MYCVWIDKPQNAFFPSHSLIRFATLIVYTDDWWVDFRQSQTSSRHRAITFILFIGSFSSGSAERKRGTLLMKQSLCYWKSICCVISFRLECIRAIRVNFYFEQCAIRLRQNWSVLYVKLRTHFTVNVIVTASVKPAARTWWYSSHVQAIFFVAFDRFPLAGRRRKPPLPWRVFARR